MACTTRATSTTPAASPSWRACGAPASHEVIARALCALEHLEHRGAEGADPDTGDGAGILIQLPDAFLRAEAGFELPEPGRYGVAVCFLPSR